MTTRSQIKRRRLRGVGRFTRSENGVATIEFAFLIPLLMLMSFGAFEIGRAVIVHKRMQRATDMVADLVAREEQLGTTHTLSDQALDGIMRAAEHSMHPYSRTPLKMGVMSIRANIANAANTTVEWSYKFNNKSNVTNCPTAKAMPQADMITAGNTAIMVETEYQYTPLLTNIIPGLIKPILFKDTMVYSPRKGPVEVPKDDDNNSANDPACAPQMSGMPQ
jgi:Flp pilus assembly protein TadG